MISAHLRHGLPALLGGLSLTELKGHFRANVDAFPIELLGFRANPAAKAPPIRGRLSVQAQGGSGAFGPILVGFGRLNDVRLEPKAPPMNLAVKGHLTRYVTTATAAFAAPDLGRHRLTVRGRTPQSIEEVGDLHSMVDRVEKVTLRSEALTLAALRALGVGPPRAQGVLRADFQAGPGLSNPRATVAIDHVRVSPAVAPLNVRAELYDTPGGLRFEQRSTMGGAPFVSADVRSSARWSELLRAPDRIAAAPVRGSIRSTPFAVRRAWTDAADRRDVEGLVALTASVTGTLGAPIIESRWAFDHLRLGPTRFDRFVVDQRVSPGGRRWAADLQQSDGGRLEARFDSSLAHVEARMTATNFDLSFMSAIANLTDAGAGIDGTLDGAISVTGPPSGPAWVGTMGIDDLRLAVPDLPALSGGKLRLTVAQREARLSLKARSGVGRVTMDLEGGWAVLAEPRLKGTFSLREVPVAAAGHIVHLSVDGQLAGHGSAAGTDAEIVLLEGGLRLPDVTPRPLHDASTPADVVFREGRWRPRLPTVGPIASAPRFTLRVRSQGPLEIRGQPVQAMFGLNLVAKRRPQGIAWAGDVSIAQGSVRLFGRRYTVDRAQAVLSGRTPPDPRLDIRLSHKFDNCTFFVDLVGTADAPKVVLSATPDIYDDKQLFAFLFGGTPDGDRDNRLPAHQTLDLAAWMVLDQVQSRIKPALPFDTLAVDLGEGADSGQANVTLGKWVTEQLFVAYAYHHGASEAENTSEGVLRYRFLRSWLLEMVFGDRGNGGADLLWTKRW